MSLLSCDRCGDLIDTDNDVLAYNELLDKWHCQECRHEMEDETPVQHDSDCALHNEPAMPNGPCDCSQASDNRTHEES